MKDKSKSIFESKKDIFNFGLGLIILIIIFLFCWKISLFSLEIIKNVFDKYPTISVALISGLLAFFSVIVGKNIENRNNIKNKIREERQEVYIDFLNWIINTLLYSETVDKKTLAKGLKENQDKIVIYASDSVLKAWAELRNAAINSEKTSKEWIKRVLTNIF